MIKIVSHEFVFDKSKTEMCHASTILKCSDGSLLCAWFGGTKEGNDDVSIWLSRKTNKWSDPKVVASSEEPHWNPVLFQMNEKEIIMFYKVGKEIRNWKTMCIYSSDNGQSWNEPTEMVEGDTEGRGPVRNKPIRLYNGRILAPASTENGIWKSFVDCSDDGGTSWQSKQNIKIENITYEEGKRTVAKSDSDIPVSEQSFYGRGVIQPTIWEEQNGNVHMFMRSTEGNIYRSDSLDMGESWCNAYKTSLPNNNSGIDLVKMDNGSLVLIYNPVSVNWGERTPISLAVSNDNGESWSKLKDLDSGEGEFSYPAIIADGKDVYITYTYKRKTIAFWKIEII